MINSFFEWLSFKIGVLIFLISHPLTKQRFVHYKEEPRYSVEWMEQWGLEFLSCSQDLDKAKKVLTGKLAEGKNAWINVEVEHSIHLEEV